MQILSACLWAVQPAMFYTSFEEFAPGEFTTLENALGTWTAAQGKASVSSYYRSGRQCLHLAGGETAVELVLPADRPEFSHLSFWAERFTAQDPFQFRILAGSQSGWKEIYNGDAAIKTGRGFLSWVKVGLPEQNCSALRFVCTAPPGKGILIDDLQLHRPAAMTLQNVTTAQWVGPVLLRKPHNPVLAVKVVTEGVLNPLTVTSLTITPEGTTNTSAIESFRIFYTGTEERFSTDSAFGSAQNPSDTMFFAGRQVLQEGVNYFWVSCTLKASANLFDKVDASCIQITADGQNLVPNPASGPIAKRIGYNVRDAGDDGVRGYRIPGLAATLRGTLIAVYDIRRHGMGDLPGDIDVGMSRSTDGGQSWEPMKVIIDMGPPHDQNGVGDPAVLVDKTDNTIWVAALWSKGNRAWSGSGPGMSPDETGQFVLVNSRDDGLTWSEPIVITPQIKDPKWRLVFQCPGNGITLRDGTLVFPAQFKDENDVPYSTLVYSKDHGQTWNIGSGAKSNTTEAQIAELNDGSLMLNMRDNRGGWRSVCVTRDLGRTWQEHPTSRCALPEPVCMASFIRFSSILDGDTRNILLFSNPATAGGRRNMTIKASLDEGMTWPQQYHTVFYEPPCAGYSCMTRIDKHTVGILYEGGDSALLIFEKFPIAEIVPE